MKARYQIENAGKLVNSEIVSAILKKMAELIGTGTEDEILDRAKSALRSTFSENIYIHRGGHHVAVCEGWMRIAIITAE